MPSVFIPMARFPNVPFLAGVPQLVRSALFQPANHVSLGTQAQSGLWASSQIAPVWGIFDANGNRVVTPDNIYAFNYRAEWRESDYPVEGGGFDTYNKVIVPFENAIRMTKGGTLSDRTAFLKQVDAIAPLTTVYSIRTPEKTYLSVNVLRVEMTRRSSEGAYFIEVDMTFRNVNQLNPQYSTTAANTANAQNPPALPSINQGNVQLLSGVSTQTSAQAAAALVQAPF
jgi:hypothetical protein